MTMLIQPHRLAVGFIDYVNSIGTNLQVAHRYDETSGATSTDKRTGQSTHTGTFSGNYVRNMDTSLEQGSGKAAMVGRGTNGWCLVQNYNGAVGSTFTFAMVVRFWRFHQTFSLVDGAGTGWTVQTTDEGSGAKIRLIKTGGGTVATSTVTITDGWRDHLVIVSMGGSTASTRIVIDGVECTGTITTQTAGTATTRTLGFGFNSTSEELCLSAYAEWTRQLTTVEEANLLVACQFNYRPRHLLHGVHSPVQFYDTSIQQQMVDAVSTNLKADLARMDLRWANIQTSSGGAYDWTRMDSAVDKFVAAGITPLVTINGSPTWRTGGTDQFCIPAAVDFAAWLTDFAAFVTTAVNRYKDRVHYWEIWNEPNFGSPDDGFWRPLAAHTTTTAGYTLPVSTVAVASTAGFASSGTAAIDNAAITRSEFTYTGITATSFTGCSGGSGSFLSGALVQQYPLATWGSNFASLCNSLRTAIVTEDPTAKVCTGGLLGYNAIGMGPTGRSLLIQAVIAGLSSSFAYYGIHPYPGDSNGPRVVADFNNNFSDLRRMRDDLISFGRPNTTIWATEYGWYFSSDMGANINATNTKLAESIQDLIHYYSSFVDMFVYFVDFDRPDSGFYGLMTGLNAAGAGVITGPELSPKITADTFKAYALTHSA